MGDFLDDKRREIDARLRELRPLVEEHTRLEQAAAALAQIGPPPRHRGRPQRAARRPRK